MIWDTGHGYAHPARETLAQATLIGGLLLTGVVWGAAYFYL
jgi:succinate dehydrogenase / fumarate reductase cytochrome b subunit